MNELPESRLLTLIDGPREFAAYFLEVGFYIDSDSPQFRLKIETSHNGATRCMLLPEEFEEFPDAMHGVARLLKLFPRNRPPYESVLRIEGLALKEIVNRALTESYQVNSSVIVSAATDQSLMLHQLPLLATQDDYEYSRERLDERRAEIREAVRAIFARSLHDVEEIADAFSAIGFRLIAHRAVRFQCSCSHERMLQNLIPVWAQEGERLFEPGASELSLRCEYCKTGYQINRDELTHAAHPKN